MKKKIYLLIILPVFLLGCPKDKGPDPQTNDRETISGFLLLRSEFPSQINCDTSFEVKKIKIQTRKATSGEASFIVPGCRPIVSLRVRGATVMEMDVSKYKGIKKFTIWIHHTNAYSLNDGSFIGLYDFDNNLISSKSSTNDYANTIVEFTKNLENLKKIKIVGKAEVTDISQISFH